MSTGIRLTFEYVQDFFAKAGCELLETEYKNARTKLRYRCVCGNESSIVFDSFRQGNRCRKCGNNRCAKKQMLTHDYVAEQFEKRGCKLLDAYTKSSVPVRFICVCGGEGKISWNNFHTKQRYCAACGLKNRSGENHYEWIADRAAKKAFDDFKQRCYKTLKAALKCAGLKKNSRTEALLGYSIREFKKHIENHPNWKNVKDQRWHVDHIFPIKAFADYGIKDIKIINSLDNLQPLLYNLNISKSDKYDADKFERWLESKGIKYDK